MFQEKECKPTSGALMLIICLAIAGLATAAFVLNIIWLGLSLSILLSLIIPGFFINDPNESRVLILFGKYIGTARENGFFWVNPFMIKKVEIGRAHV